MMVYSTDEVQSKYEVGGSVYDRENTNAGYPATGTDLIRDNAECWNIGDSMHVKSAGWGPPALRCSFLQPLFESCVQIECVRG